MINVEARAAHYCRMASTAAATTTKQKIRSRCLQPFERLYTQKWFDTQWYGISPLGCWQKVNQSPYPKQAFKTRSPPGTRWDIQVQTGYTGRRVVSPTRGSNCWGSSERILRFHMGKLNFSQKKGLLRMVVRWEIAT